MPAVFFILTLRKNSGCGIKKAAGIVYNKKRFSHDTGKRFAQIRITANYCVKPEIP